jgi:hypothetical protein
MRFGALHQGFFIVLEIREEDSACKQDAMQARRERERL